MVSRVRACNICAACKTGSPPPPAHSREPLRPTGWLARQKRPWRRAGPGALFARPLGGPAGARFFLPGRKIITIKLINGRQSNSRLPGCAYDDFQFGGPARRQDAGSPAGSLAVTSPLPGAALFAQPPIWRQARTSRRISFSIDPNSPPGLASWRRCAAAAAGQRASLGSIALAGSR